MRKLITTILLLTALFPLFGQEGNIVKEFAVMDMNSITDEQLDTIDIKKKLVINDYSMVGFQYGVGLSRVMWNPSQKQDMVFTPINAGITFTTYGKMFGYMPFFGFQAGVFYAREGYQFKYNEEKDYINKIAGAEKALIDVVEVPILFQFHYDMWNFKILAQIGCYGGYRLSIERFEGKTGNIKPENKYSFLDTDRRWDYGIKGGAGFAMVFEPMELQFLVSYKHSLSSLYEPDYANKYYYRFAYPSNIVISVGANFHITKRTGKTKSEIKRMARESVYNRNNLNGDTKSTGR